MAQKHIVQLIDDIDSSEADETIVFGIDGVIYEIDLNAKHAGELRDALALYVAHGRRSAARSERGGSRRPGPPRVDREQIAAIREWARSNGHSIGSKGRIPSHIVEAYNSAR